MSQRVFLMAAMAAMVALCWAPATLRAQGIRVVIDRNEITVEDQFVLQVAIQGTRNAQPQMPDLSAFRVVDGGQQTEIQVVNGAMTSGITFTLYLLPTEAGRFTIGPASVEIEGKVYTSKPFAVTVHPASAEPIASRDYFLSARVSDSTPYVGQQVLYTWQFYRRLYVEVDDARLTSLDFGSILSEELGEVRQYQTTLDGVEYVVSEIRRALFPQRSGELVIPASELVCQVAVPNRRRRRSLFDLGRVPMEKKILRTEPIALTVRPLPAPPGDYSGLVGEFEIRAALSKNQLQVGESTTLSVTLEGAGNAQMLREPDLPELTGFKVYDDKPSGDLDRRGDRLFGRKTYRKALVPLVAGEHQVPPIRLVYFDPGPGVFRTRATETMPIEVTPSDSKEELMLTESVAPTTGKVAVRILADDILPNRRGLDALKGRRIAGWRAWGWAGSAVFSPLAFLGLFALRRRQSRFENDRGLRRRRDALRTSLQRLDEIALNRVARFDPPTFAREASLCVRHYVGDRLGAAGGVLTPKEVENLLAAADVDEAAVRRVRELLERFEATQYGVRSLSLDQEQLVRSLAQLLKDVDRQLGPVR